MTTFATQTSTQRIAELAGFVLSGRDLSLDEARELTAVEGDDLFDLFFWANKIRIQRFGRSVKFCSIVASKVGACSEDCGYCTQSKFHATHVTPSKMTVGEMVSAAEEAKANGASSFGLVNSGRGPTERELDWMEPFFRKTAQEGTIRPCATLGELTESQAKRLHDMGVLRVNHNLETSRRHFPNIISSHSYEDRVKTIRIAKAAGLSICSGGIFGMGEAWDDRLDMALELRELGADVIPINFLNAMPGTPVYDRKLEPLTPLEALHIVAVYRFVLPDRELKIAGGREKILRDMQSWMFFAGGSSFLIGNYLTTFGRTPAQDHQMLKDLGLPYATFDEIEHEADPSAARADGPTDGLMVRRPGAMMSLPVVNQGEKLKAHEHGGSCCGR